MWCSDRNIINKWNPQGKLHQTLSLIESQRCHVLSSIFFLSWSAMKKGMRWYVTLSICSFSLFYSFNDHLMSPNFNGVKYNTSIHVSQSNWPSSFSLPTCHIWTLKSVFLLFFAQHKMYFYELRYISRTVEVSSL